MYARRHRYCLRCYVPRNGLTWHRNSLCRPIASTMMSWTRQYEYTSTEDVLSHDAVSKWWYRRRSYDDWGMSIPLLLLLRLRVEEWMYDEPGWSDSNGERGRIVEDLASMIGMWVDGRFDTVSVRVQRLCCDGWIYFMIVIATREKDVVNPLPTRCGTVDSFSWR